MTDLRKAAGKCGCGANLYIDENGKPCSKALAQPEQDHSFDRTASHMAGEYVDTAQPEQEVNAELLEALKRIAAPNALNADHRVEACREALREIARAAIAKATGEQA